MIILPSQYDSTPCRELLIAANRGLVALDQRLISALIRRQQETADALAELMKDKSRKAPIMLEELAMDLFRHFRNKDSAAYFVSLIADDPTTMTDEAIEALSELGELAVEPLLDLYKAKAADEKTADEAPDILFALAATGVHDPRVRALLLDLLARDPYEGALCIGLYRDQGLLPELKSALANLDPALTSEHGALKDCVEALSTRPSFEPPEPYSLEDLYPEVTGPFFEIWDYEWLKEALYCPAADFRTGAALSLADEEYPDELRDKLVDLASTDPEPQVRVACLKALATRTGERAVARLLEQVAGDGDQAASVRAGALVGLSSLASTQTLERLLPEFLAIPETRALALEAVWRSGARSHEGEIQQALHDEDAEVRRQAVRGAGALKIGKLAIELVPMFQDPDLRFDALAAYAAIVQRNINPKTVEVILEDIGRMADGLTDSESEAVCDTLDERLESLGFEPVFSPYEDIGSDEEPGEEHRAVVKAGRNDPCPCGSGKKFKKCCGA